jgi:PAS domain S-box-containing protein
MGDVIPGDVHSGDKISTTISDFLPGEGEMARAVNAKNWHATPLGPVSGWPPCIRTAVSICLGSNFQIMVLVGAELAYIYNDACIPIFGDKHPEALGRRVADVWPEAWETIAPVLESVMLTGKAVRQDDWPLMLNRSGFAEQCFFTLSYSQIRCDADRPAGVFVAVMETTRRVLGERRQRTLRELATQVALRRGDDATFELVRQTLAANAFDLPLTALYLAAPGGDAEQVFCTGLHDGCAGVKRRTGWRRDAPVDGAGAAHPLVRLAKGCGPQLYDADELLGQLDTCGAWPERPRQVSALPLPAGADGAPRGFLLVALNPRAALDDEYRQFIDTVAGLVASAVAGVDAIAFDAERARAAAELDRSKHDLAGVLAGTSDAFISLDPELRLLTLNDAAVAGLGATRAELVGRSFVDLLPATMAMTLEPALRAALARGELVSLEQCNPRTGRWYNVRCYPAPQGLLVFGNDITERKESERMLVAAKRELEGRFELRTEELREANRLLGELYQRLQTVREAERTALAREVHDQLGQILSAAKIDVKLLEGDLSLHGAALAPAKIITELRSAGATLDRAMQLVRDIATDLRAPELDGQGLYSAIEWYARDFERRTRVKVHLELGAGLAQPARPAGEALLCIFHEALTNVLRHAQASCVWVSLERRAGALLLRVRDDGAGIGIGVGGRRAHGGGPVRPVRSLGITGMRERAAMAHGRLTVGPLTPRGTLVSALIPMDPAGAGSGEGTAAGAGESA